MNDDTPTGGFRLTEDALDGWELAKTARMGDEGETTYLWRQGDALARVVVAELEDDRAARERLDVWLEHSMRPDISDNRERLPDLGDTVHMCRDRDGVPGSLYFARGHHAVGVFRADDTPFDVVELGAAIDRLLQGWSRTG